jgi:hypothetical protein
MRYRVPLNNKTVKTAPEERNREEPGGGAKSLSTELLEIGKRCAAHVKKPLKSGDHGEMLYDKNGLPR